MTPTAFAAPGARPAALSSAGRARAAALLALLLAGATLPGCASTEAEHASQVAAMRAAATFAEAAATAYLTRGGNDLAQQAAIAAGTRVLEAALAAWAAAPADDAKAQAMQTALTTLTAALAEAGVMLAGQ
ncbi:hypothetical protein JYK14_07165 [Siccirubricoccus sp. KC 17139]|uniref:Lipoprotein n=1 Tax=Siccirubricoccus soli TaxID=2899147 RepID=A0ABT1D203_9PROT|nr:hypothetical protein [Siccirubricoccus soli]MCO6415957.1 hypothetical protein [Siccirubricoccus soli]MCP2682089.1 hypothetical protein [Siccirubricoccus soli]